MCTYVAAVVFKKEGTVRRSRPTRRGEGRLSST